MKKTGSLEAALAKYAKSSKVVRVGFIDDAAYPEDQGGESVAQVAYWNEYGTLHTPPRPFFRKTFRDNRSKWQRGIRTLLQSHDEETAYRLLGEKIQGQLRDAIMNWSSPANAPSTVKRKGFDSPLRDTGFMVKAIDVEVADYEP